MHCFNIIDGNVLKSVYWVGTIGMTSMLICGLCEKLARQTRLFYPLHHILHS